MYDVQLLKGEPSLHLEQGPMVPPARFQPGSLTAKAGSRFKGFSNLIVHKSLFPATGRT
jgi:hypothetical protein